MISVPQKRGRCSRFSLSYAGGGVAWGKGVRLPWSCGVEPPWTGGLCCLCRCRCASMARRGGRASERATGVVTDQPSRLRLRGFFREEILRAARGRMDHGYHLVGSMLCWAREKERGGVSVALSSFLKLQDHAEQASAFIVLFCTHKLYMLWILCMVSVMLGG